MTGSGQTLPSRDFYGTAALPLKPDIGWRGWHVRKVPIGDIGVRLFDHLIGAVNTSSQRPRRTVIVPSATFYPYRCIAWIGGHGTLP
jgi:hypothetical protein